MALIHSGSRLPVQALLKRFALIYLPIVLVLSIALLLSIRHDDLGRVEEIKANVQGHINVASGLIAQDFDVVTADLRFIANLPLLSHYLESGNPVQREELEQLFLTLSREMRRYDQVRYLDADGQEIIRINYNEGNPAIVPHEQLQNKSKRYYFHDTMNLDRGGIFVSPLDLNIEQGRLEIPYRPMIRFGTPVFDRAGGKKGMILLNYMGDGLLQHFRRAMQRGVLHHSMLLNRDGYWLSSGKREDEWGFMLGNSERTFGQDYPEAWRVISGAEQGTLRTGKGLFVYTTVYPLPSGQITSTDIPLATANRPQKLPAHEYYWKIVSHVPHAVLFETAFLRQTGGRMLLAFVYLMLALAAWIIATITLSRRQALAELAGSKARYDGLVRHIPVGVYLFYIHADGSMKFEYVSPMFCQITCLDAEAVLRDAGVAFAAVHPDDRDSLSRANREAAAELQHFLWEGRFIACGDTRWVRIESDPKPQPGGGSLWSGVIADITEQRLAREALRIAAVTFETHEAILITDVNANIIRVNRAFADITGYQPEDVLGKNPRMLSAGREGPAFYAEMWRQLLESGIWSGEVWDRRKDGLVYPKWLTITAVKNEQGQTTEYVAIFNDITERKDAEEEIRNLAFYDALTLLPNRRLLLDRLHLALLLSARNRLYGAVLFIDMDRFKTLNDTLGHDYGDLMLVEVASRLHACVRDADTVARLGGDEFVILIEEVSANADEASQKIALIAEKIRAELAVPYQLREHESHSSPSIGVCLYRGNEDSVEVLLKRADLAMYQAKDSGRNAVRFFDPAMQRSVEAHAGLEADLRHALHNQELHLHYQIQVNNARRPLGAEALVRWVHPKRGMVSPAQFIPIAEESSLILDIGHWVLDTACRQLAVWGKHEQMRGLELAVNVSAQQFSKHDFVEVVAAVLRVHQVDPAHLKLELTEGVVLTDVAGVVTKMRALKALGIKLSLDDFGTGYSSLSYLKQLPLDQIKIDQSFIRDIATDQSDAVMVQAIIGMATSFHLNVIAEGVESEAQLDFLKQNGCLAYQGYLFGKPVPIEEFEALIGNFQALS